MKLFGTVYAHCDVPCGVYETDTMLHAAHTTRVMCKKIAQLGDLSEPEHLASFTRMVAVKERHAERVKREVAIIWADYFKPEHIETYQNLHDLTWRTLKQASAVKQGLAEEDATKLIALVEEFAAIYHETKQ